MSESRTKMKTDLVILDKEIILTERVLAERTCCRVYKATWKGAPVAIKCLRMNSLPGASASSASDQNRREALRQELGVMCKLRYPNIVTLYGVYARDTLNLGLVMELMETSLEDRTMKGPALQTPCIVHVLQDVTAALTYIHSFDVIHRDVCPRNILLSGDTAQGKLVARLADFAASKMADTIGSDPSSSMSGQFQIDTLPYLPYEAIDKDPITEKYVYSSTLDVYSVGAVGLFAALQKVPGVSPRGKPDYLRQLGTEHMLYGIIKDCLYDDPPQRRSSADLQRRLQTLQASEACQNCNCCVFSTGAASSDSQYHQEATAVQVFSAPPTSAQTIDSSTVVSTANQTQLSRQQDVGQASSSVRQTRQADNVVTNPSSTQQTATTSSAERLLSEPTATSSCALSSQVNQESSVQPGDGGSAEASQQKFNWENCARCSKRGHLALCDSCQLAYHWYCLKPRVRLKDLPEKWCCPVCKVSPTLPPEVDPPTIELWKTEFTERHLDNSTVTKCYKLLKYLQKHENSVHFREPVKKNEVRGYHEYIKKPMDLSTVEKRLHNGEYRKKENFISDLFLIFDNCDHFNQPYTEIAGLGRFMRQFLCDQLQQIQWERLSQPRRKHFLESERSPETSPMAEHESRDNEPIVIELDSAEVDNASGSQHQSFQEPLAKRRPE